MSNLILVFNCGSSSIKFALFDADATPMPLSASWSGKVDGITGPAPTYEQSGTAPLRIDLDGNLPGSPPQPQPYHAALAYINRRIDASLGNNRIVAVAHRVVHGGTRYSEPVLLDATVLADLRSYIPLAPLHQPFALDAIESLLVFHRNLPQIACFDTAFHHTLPRVEQMLPLPYSAWERGLRRYGFHGLSYEFMSVALPQRHGDLARKRTLVAHLGSGASLCAMQNLQSVATTMGFSALDGLMMGTRCGSLDPGALIYLMEVEKLTLHEVGQLLYHDSGLLGISGVSSDPRELLPVEAGNLRVQDALALYVRRIVCEIGALTAVLGGLDMLVFTAGIGEHNSQIRARICRDLGFLGVTLDAGANAADMPIISNAQSRVIVAVEPTNEEWIAAGHARSLMSTIAS